MIFVALDTETTGIDPAEHRFVEIYASKHHMNGDLIAKFYKRIDPQRTIQAEAQRVHGISYADVAGCPTFADVAGELVAFLDEADFIVAHNGDEFDIPFINSELKRVGKPKIEKPTVDTMKQGRWATPNGKVPNLGELCFACGVDYDPAKAHAADYDVNVMADCFVRGVFWGFYELPATDKELKEALAA